MTATYLVNRSPSSAIDFLTLEEKWTGKAPSLAYLRLFDCLAYVQHSEGKLEPGALKCIFLGYPQGVKCYRL